jgi:hypothetical protein
MTVPPTSLLVHPPPTPALLRRQRHRCSVSKSDPARLDGRRWIPLPAMQQFSSLLFVPKRAGNSEFGGVARWK